MSLTTTTSPSTFMNTGLPLLGSEPYKVHSLDPELVAFGRKEIELAEHEMPGLMALRRQHGDAKPQFVGDCAQRRRERRQ